MFVPLVKLLEQVPGHRIPTGLLVTTPDPVTVSERTGAETNVAVTDSAALIVTAQVVAAPEHPPPDHPVKV